MDLFRQLGPAGRAEQVELTLIIPLPHDRETIEQRDTVLLRHHPHIVEKRLRRDHGFSAWTILQIHQDDVSPRILQCSNPFGDGTAKLVGIAPDDRTTIIGDPIGREALIEELRSEMIQYTPEELVQIANREFDWCIAELKKASREMGFGDDYMKAIEAVKQKYVEPGKQPALIRDQAREAIEYVKKNDLVTVPKTAEETWRMEMMTPERQLVAPFFLGGETILVSYPTDGMTHEQKMMSMRGNNPHFARAVTHHELIPGHHLQQFMTRRYRPYRELFRTPFWGEGWALYWEFILWDRGFVKTPEDKIGALFWRSHRAARSLAGSASRRRRWSMAMASPRTSPFVASQSPKTAHASSSRRSARTAAASFAPTSFMNALLRRQQGPAA